MTLHYSFNNIEPIWISGQFPLGKKNSRKVKVKLAGKTHSHFPSILEIGDLLCGIRPSDYYMTLLLTYPHTTVTSIHAPSSTIYGQIRIPLPQEAISLIREVDGGDEYSYELTLESVELENKTKR